MKEMDVLKLPITEYKRKLKRAIKIGGFISGNGITFIDEDEKFDNEYKHLKEIGYL